MLSPEYKELWEVFSTAFQPSAQHTSLVFLSATLLIPFASKLLSPSVFVVRWFPHKAAYPGSVSFLCHRFLRHRLYRSGAGVAA